MAVNLTNLTGSVTTLEGAGQFANDATGGYFWGLILVAITVILLINMLRYGFDRAMAGAAFAGLFLSLPLLYLQWVNLIYPIMYGVALAGTLFYMRFKTSQSL